MESLILRIEAALVSYLLLRVDRRVVNADAACEISVVPFESLCTDRKDKRRVSRRYESVCGSESQSCSERHRNCRSDTDIPHLQFPGLCSPTCARCNRLCIREESGTANMAYPSNI